MAKIIPFKGVTKLDLSPDQVLEKAKGQLEGVLVVGFDKDGKFYGSSSYADGGTIIWLIDACKKKILEGV